MKNLNFEYFSLLISQDLVCNLKYIKIIEKQYWNLKKNYYFCWKQLISTIWTSKNLILSKSNLNGINKELHISMQEKWSNKYS